MAEPNDEILSKLEQVQKRLEQFSTETLTRLDDMQNQVGELLSKSDVAASYGFLFGAIAVAALGVSLIGIGESLNGLIMLLTGLFVIFVAVLSFRYPRLLRRRLRRSTEHLMRRRP